MKRLQFKNIFGKKENVSLPYKSNATTAKSVHEALNELFEKSRDWSDIIKIHGAPDEQGDDFVVEEGKIYYDIDGETYYLGGNEAYYQIPTIDDVVYGIQNNEEYWVCINEWPILTAPEQRKINGVPQPGHYDIRPFTLYTGGFNAVSGTQGQTPMLDIALLDGSAVSTREYCFYYTQSGSTVPQISIHVNEAVTQVTVPDSVAELIADMEDGHTYEFNIFNNVLLVTDITYTASNEEPIPAEGGGK